MTPNQVTAARVAAAFAAVLLFASDSHRLWADAGAMLLIVAAIALDALDGYIARRKNMATPLGAQFDILGDRVVENLLFTFFATAGLITLWVPVLFFVRGTLTDFLRSVAARAGRSGFGNGGMLETWWGRLLVASRGSRAGYAALKCVCFCALGIRWTMERCAANAISPDAAFWVQTATKSLVGATVMFCLLRAVPVLWEGRKFLAALAPMRSNAVAGEAQ